MYSHTGADMVKLERTLSIAITKKIGRKYKRITIDRLPSFINLINNYTTDIVITDKKGNILDRPTSIDFTLFSPHDIVERLTSICSVIVSAILDKSSYITNLVIKRDSINVISGMYGATLFTIDYTVIDSVLELNMSVQGDCINNIDLTDTIMVLYAKGEEGLFSTLIDYYTYHNLVNFYTNSDL